MIDTYTALAYIRTPNYLIIGTQNTLFWEAEQEAGFTSGNNYRCLCRLPMPCRHEASLSAVLSCFVTAGASLLLGKGMCYLSCFLF